MSINSIISQIATKAVTIWNDVVTDIDTDVAKIKAAWPAAGTVIDELGSDVKQGASDLIGAADSELNTLAPVATSAVEGAADALLAKYSGGLALPLTGLTNDAIDKVSALIVSTANGWALKAKAALAENTAAQHGGTPAPQ